MISVKSSTRTWSPAEQTSSLKGAGESNLSSAEQERLLGEQDLGTYLNKIADPNYVDPVKSKRVGNPEMGKDAFLKLFLAQLKNQDPTSPLESHEMAAQLAQFSALEKLESIDTGITDLSKANDPAKSFDTLNLIGKGVGGDSSKIIRTDETDSHEINFTLGAPVEELQISIRNRAGEEIKVLSAKALKPGANKVSWDGMIENGAPAPKGDYQAVISAKSGGNNVAVQTQFEGRVTGVNYSAEGPVLMVGKQAVKLKDVKRIFIPQEEMPQATMVETKAVAGKDAKKLASKTVGMGGNLESIGMSQGLINKLEKEVTDKGPAAKDGTANKGKTL